mmetsp:Transcript_9752/g.26429  ORF Transcript_9752/g.26429 Transcript_9752/m.26429 type:complete len:447 (+) Transcript_9752:63-1403(+)
MLAQQKTAGLCTKRTVGSRQLGLRPSRPSSRAVFCPKASQQQQQSAHEPQQSWLSKVALGLATAGMIGSTMMEFAPPVDARALLASDPVKNANALLRYALPIDNKPIREIQNQLESISKALRIPGSKSLGPVAKAIKNSQNILTKQRKQIEADFAPGKEETGKQALDDLSRSLTEFAAIVDAKDKQAVPDKQRECLSYVGVAEEAMVKGMPFEVPKEYANLPQLLGRATLEMKINCGNGPEGRTDEVLTIVLDGYNAPVSAGAFLDLVERGFYNGMEIQRADGFVVQTGDPDGPGPEEGFRDPKTGEVRTVPLEVRVEGDKDPLYEFSMQDVGRVTEAPVLPFNAYGTLAWARNEFENNSASSQVFFLLKESELTPTGANLLDGRFAVFGYVTEDSDAVGYMQVGDKIDYIKVKKIDGEFLNGPESSPAPAPKVEEPPVAPTAEQQ